MLKRSLSVYLYMNNNKRELFFVWANNLSISHMRKSSHIFIYFTFQYTIYQNLIIMFKDILTGKKYPAF